VDCVHPDQERLSVTSPVLRTIFDVYRISPRFAGYISRQHMPGNATRFDQNTYQAHQHGSSTRSCALHAVSDLNKNAELWYSAVLRSTWLHGDETARDLSRKVADWRRFSLWSNYDWRTKRLEVLVMGCPPQLRAQFVCRFEGKKSFELQRHPMLLHAFFARGLLLHAYDFLQDFSGPLYEWVSSGLIFLSFTLLFTNATGTPQEFRGQKLRSAKDYTERSEAFLALSRQIQQIATDYDILDATLEFLRNENRWFTETIAALPKEMAFSARDEIEIRAPLEQTFDSFLREAKLLRTYNTLYNERTKIGVSEGFAMVNQRDAEAGLHLP